jgi:hypothetical protein
VGGRGLVALALLALAGASGCLFSPPPSQVVDSGPAGDGDGAPGGDGSKPAIDAASGPAPFVTCSAAATPPTLDATREALWSAAPLHRFEVADAEHRADLNANYTPDAAVDLRCLADADSLYFFIEVSDGATVTTRPIQIDGPDSREDDAVVLFLHAAADNGGVYNAGDHAILLPAQTGVAGDLAVDFGPLPLTPAGRIETTEGAYRVEIELARAAIATPLPDTLRFNLAVIDDDGWNDECRDVFALESQPVLPCLECCPGEDWSAECPGYSAGEALVWCDTRVSETLGFQ